LEFFISPSHATSAARILIVDDHGIVREALAVLLERSGGFKVVGTVATGEEAVLAAQRLVPDVIIMDLVLPSLNGIDATRKILERSPQIRIIALSACHLSEQVIRALHSGVRGYIVKAAVGDEVLLAVNEVLAGRQYLSPGIAAQLADSVDNATRPAGHSSPIEILSARERKVLRFVVEGMTSSDIARRLSLSPKTVDTYRSRIMVKLGVTNRSALIRYALECELPLA